MDDAATAPYLPFLDTRPTPGGLLRLGMPGAGERLIERDGQLEAMRQAKRDARAAGLRPHGHDVGAETAARSALLLALAREYTDRAAPPSDATLADVVEQLQEDVIVLRRAPGADADAATAVYVDVSFASGWCPRCALGRDFVAIHAPVPEDGHFAGARRARFAAPLFAANGEPRVRFVWTVTPDAALDRRRCQACGSAAVTSDWGASTAAYLRVERQVLLPIDATLAMFLIRVHVTPCGALEPHHRRALATQLRDMSPALARYKGLLADRARIMQLLTVAS